MIGLNVGSGTRPFAREAGWINWDSDPKVNPDVLGDWNRDLAVYSADTFDYIASLQTIEHVGCNEALPFLQQAHRILKPGGSLLAFVPDLRALAARWMTGQLDTQVFMTAVYGPYDGTEGSRHRWGYTQATFRQFLNQVRWTTVKPFDWRAIPGAEFPYDYWIIGVECIK